MSPGAQCRWFVLVGAVGVGLALAESALAFQGSLKEKMVKLKKRPLKARTFRPGYGISEALPEEGWVTRLGKRELWFLDLDGDGVIEADVDGLAIKGIPFYVRLPEILLSQQGQFHIRVDTEAGKLALVRDSLDLSPKMILKAAVLTDIRLNAGLHPVRVDSQASRHCDLHIEYLKKNGMADGRGGMAAHNEDPSKPGYTEEGAAAGAGSNLGFMEGDYRMAILEWYATAWHGATIVDPTLRTVGVGLNHGVAMLYAYEHDGFLEEPYLHPPDGAANVLRTFAAKGEVPDPVPDVPAKNLGCGCGFPVHIRLSGDLDGRRLVEARVIDAKGRQLPGKFSCPKKPATAEWPTNSSCAFFIPLIPLAGGVGHRAEFRFEGLEEPIVWEFTTGK